MRPEDTKKRGRTPAAEPVLSDEEREHILEVFSEEITPKLARLQARTGNLSCEFAGGVYRHWIARFISRGAGFEIVDFEYDEEACGIDLDP